MKYLITTTCYDGFIADFYATHSDIAYTSYRHQLDLLLQQCFGTGDFFSWNLQQLGHEADEIIVNAQQLQQQWTIESDWNFSTPTCPESAYAWQHQVLQRQIEVYRPDILYIHDINWMHEDLLRSVRPFVKLIIGQNACPLRANIDFRVYDLVLTSFPHYVSRFREQGTQSEYFQLAFEPRILGKLQKHRQVYNTSFIGGFSPNHQAGIQLFEAVARQTPIDCWGYGGSLLPEDWSLKQRYHGEAWGLKMFQLLADSKIALNRHIDVAERYANNMRLYEATGVGTCLVTDAKDNLHELFEPDHEVVTYRSAEECIEKVRYLLEHEDERAAIARAGQARTLRDHTYYQRMVELDAIVRRHLSDRDPHPTVVALPTGAEQKDSRSPYSVSVKATSSGEQDCQVFVNKARPTMQQTEPVESSTSSTVANCSVLFQIDWQGNSALETHRQSITRELVSAGHTVICVAPHLSPMHEPAITQRSLPYKPQTEFHLGMGDRASFEQLINETQPKLIIFGDACPLSNFAAKQVARDRRIPYVVVIASADPVVAKNFAPCLPDLAELYSNARQVMLLATEIQPILQQHFGLTHPNTTNFNLPITWPPFIPAIEVRVAPSASATASNHTPSPNRPEWEYLPQGWQTQDPHILGWNVRSILETQRAKWDAFAAALRTTAPLGISHESPNVTAASYGAHNTMMAFGYVLALAARKKDRISILDWGGGLGQYCLIAQALLPGVEIDYHCKDLPLLCQGGRQLLPQATFYEDEVACFQRRYDLVLSSSSLQYCQNWQTVLSQLAAVADKYLYLTRLPIVHGAQSFVVVQRPYAYGYHTEYIGWFLNRQSVLDCAERSRLQLQREFLIAEQFAVPGAPETAEARGFLFRSI